MRLIEVYPGIGNDVYDLVGQDGLCLLTRAAITRHATCVLVR
jgi:hypothetical protein